MNILVTGAAGFIGSHLCEKLLENDEHHVIGVDHFIGPTPIPLKNQNLASLLTHPRFTFSRKDLYITDLNTLLKNVDIVFHLAGIPGVRSSWGEDFDPYVVNNILVTQRFLEALKTSSVKKFIYASTSSVYGQKSGKVKEDALPEPLSPYGVTKLAGEHLCRLYEKSFHIPIVILRFFTVYGPRQRSDMAFHTFIKQILTNQPITVFGDGTQSRDFTYIDDCVNGIVSVMNNDRATGQTFNLGGTERASVHEVIRIIEQLTGKKAHIEYKPKVHGEPKHTYADSTHAHNILGYQPTVTLKEGLKKEITYIQHILKG
ncbi:NAD-dependent epimerase/dehydratase family protein [Bacillus sp. FJAT-47783]|uniref:NAD-dependent epimerase/dehydratase family protein n=1 Tax=Bacillus sp. FJAT-47783 TaxID=2922712 RepID=UPI001FABD36C|nr:NAD-dependent epimerase/dehydratase family protein [Bacillus sp. FJAT-47783]